MFVCAAVNKVPDKYTALITLPPLILPWAAIVILLIVPTLVILGCAAVVTVLAVVALLTAPDTLAPAMLYAVFAIFALGTNPSTFAAVIFANL